MVRVPVLCLLLLFCLVHTGRGRPEGETYDDYANDEDYNYDEDETTSEEPAAPIGPPPVIVSKPLALNAKPGETVYLPCDIRNLSANYAVMWFNGSVMVFTDSIATVHNPRISRFENHTLQIKNVKFEDSGDYSCKISSNPPVEITHQLLVPSPAKIVKLLPGSDQRTVELGSSLTLECEAQGHPHPQVTWSKPGSEMPQDKKVMKNGIVKFPSVTMKHAGTYECRATNGMGDGDVMMITIIVQYGPKIQVMKDVVNSGVGYESELQCKVDADPKATVSWFMNSKPVVSGGHIKVEAVDKVHTLRITKTANEDFGTYTCVAKNSVSTATATIELTATPSTAKFLTSNSSGNSVTLKWVVESHAPISEYTLRYRKRKTNEWRTESPVVEDAMGNQYKVIHTLLNLAPGDYEVQLSSKNSYGLSKESTPEYFNVKDYGEAAPSKVEDASNPGSNAVNTRPLAALVVSLLCLRTILQ